MTKYILVGGYPYKAKDGGRQMCQEAVDGLSEPINVLICLFARQKEQWNKLFEDNKDFFERNLPEKTLHFELATEKDFVEQIKGNNLIYFSGGDTIDFVEALNKQKGWQEALTGKNVMGSSAGTEFLSKYCYDIEFFKLCDNFGLVPIKTIVHYGSPEYEPPIGWERTYELLDGYKEKLPILALAEGEYKVIEV